MSREKKTFTHSHSLFNSSLIFLEMSNSTYILEEETINSYDLLIPISIRFWLYLIPDILSPLCSIFVLFHPLFDQTLRQALHNHIIIILLCIGLIYELTSVPLL
jgi:hypothetical protein